MKIYFTLFFSVYTIALFSQGTIKVEHFLSGKANYKEYKLTDDRGWVKKPFYRNLYNDGKITAYYDNGDLEFSTTIVNGKKEGAFVSYHESGNLAFSCFCKENKIVGVANWYYTNGQLKKVLIFNPNTKEKESLPWQVVACYTIDGKKLNPGTLKDGNGTINLYHEDGELYSYNIYKNGIKVY